MNSGFDIAALSAVTNSSPLQTRQVMENAAKTSGITGEPAVEFSTLLAGAASNFTETVKKAEASSIAGIKGEVDVYQVASTVMEAEQAIKLAVAVRNKIVSAYLEISRMQI